MDLISSLRGFFKDSFNQKLFLVLLLLGVVLTVQDYYFVPQEDPTPSGNYTSNVTVDFFYHPQCPHCKNMKPIIAELERDFPDVRFSYHDTSIEEEKQLMIDIAESHGMSTEKLFVPATFIDKFNSTGTYSQFNFTGEYPKFVLQAAIEECVNQCVGTDVPRVNQSNLTDVSEIDSSVATGSDVNLSAYPLPFIGETNLLAFSLPVIAMVVGLIDGFNPCAMWVLVYMISVIANVKDRRKIWLIVGSFVFASGVLYFLFMTFWLNVFLLLGYIRVINIAVGLVALGAGILNIKSYLENKGVIECTVENAQERRKTMKKIDNIITSPLSWSIFFAIVVLAFAVNSIEFVCSSGLPIAFTNMLTSLDLPMMEYYFYIALYDFFFMLDDLIIFGIAAFAVTSGIGERYAKWSKLLGGLILLILGILILFFPDLIV